MRASVFPYKYTLYPVHSMLTDSYEHTHTETQIRGAREEYTFNRW